VVEPADIDRISQELAGRYRGRLFVTQSEDIHVELLNPRANKGAALEAVAKRLDLEAEDVVAVGDGINDIEMIRWAGTGVAVAHAKPQLKAEADMVLAPDAEALTTFLASLAPRQAS
jgi:hydroxymethylpyrimidine pyrophosphatase-like HAD family hydrolase